MMTSPSLTCHPIYSVLSGREEGWIYSLSLLSRPVKPREAHFHCAVRERGVQCHWTLFSSICFLSGLEQAALPFWTLVYSVVSYKTRVIEVTAQGCCEPQQCFIVCLDRVRRSWLLPIPLLLRISMWTMVEKAVCDTEACRFPTVSLDMGQLLL